MAAESFFALVALGDVVVSFFDDVHRQVIAGLIFISPIDHPVTAHDHAFGVRVLGGDRLQLQTKVKTRALPWRPDQIVAVDFLGQFFGVLRRRHGNNRVRMHVIDVFARNKRVQRRVDRGRPWIQIEGAVRVHADHVVFHVGLRTFDRRSVVERNQFQ